MSELREQAEQARASECARCRARDYGCRSYICITVLKRIIALVAPELAGLRAEVEAAEAERDYCKSESARSAKRANDAWNEKAELTHIVVELRAERDNALTELLDGLDEQQIAHCSKITLQQHITAVLLLLKVRGDERDQLRNRCYALETQLEMVDPNNKELSRD